MNIIFTHVSFYFFFHFHRTLFRGLAGAYMNPGRFSLFVHSFVCPITHSFLYGFQPNLVQHFPHVAMLYLSYCNRQARPKGLISAEAKELL